MKNNKLVSIIIPVFNCEKCIEKCINSLINQTYKNIEIILINDGSTDKSLKIIKKFKDNRIVLIDQKNLGANAARKSGIDKAKGEYCVFVDADDWIDLNTIEELIKIINENDYEIIKYNCVLEPSKKLKNSYNFNGLPYVEIEKKHIYELLINSKILHNLCFGIYKTKVLSNIEAFNSEISNCEDYWANLEIYSKVEKILLLNKSFYHYRENENSTTKSVNYSKIIKNSNELVFVYGKLFSYIDKWNINTKNNQEIVAFEILEAARSSVFNIFNVNKLNKKDTIRFISSIFEKEVFEYIRKNIEYSQILKLLKKKPLKYKLKNYFNIKFIYYKKYRLLWLNYYLFKLR